MLSDRPAYLGSSAFGYGSCHNLALPQDRVHTAAAGIEVAMRLTIRAFGLDLLDMEITTEVTSPEIGDYDPASILSGGNLGAYPIDAGPTDRYMGFTSGLGYEDE